MLYIHDERKNKYGSYAKLIEVIDGNNVLVEYSDPVFVEVGRAVLSTNKFIAGVFSSPFDRRIAGSQVLDM